MNRPQVILSNYKAYRPLLHELVGRDLKVKYRRSFLGYLWSLLNPILMMEVMALVFQHFFLGTVENFTLYLICGQTLFSFFTESTNMAMNSILGNATLIKKIYIPKYIFPISRVLSSFVTMSFSLVAILLVMIFTHAKVYWTVVLFPIPILCLFLFCCGVGMILSSLSVYFRDITHLWGVLTLAWMYATPIFYTVESMPDEVKPIIMANPMCNFITMFRNLVMFGQMPTSNEWITCTAFGVIFFILGMGIFARLQKNFILHI